LPLRSSALQPPACYSFTPAAPTSEPIEVGSEKQLFLDDSLTAHAYRLKLTVNPPQKTYEKNLVSDRPFEDMLIGGFTTMQDEGIY
jgi:hypothetical protein